MNKYKEKSIYEDDRFIKEDDEYLLKEIRPAKESSIRKLPKNKLDKFIDDVLTDRKFTNVLYSTNSKIEIKNYKKNQSFLEKYHNQNQPKKEKDEPSSVVKKRSRREAYLQIRNEVDNFKTDKQNKKEFLTQKNNENFFRRKKEIEKQQNEYFDSLKENRLNGFRKSFDKIRDKLRAIKINNAMLKTTTSTQETKNSAVNEIPPAILPIQNTLRQPKTINNKNTDENVISETNEINAPFYAEGAKVIMPDIKLNINNVYSRLYNNAVLLDEKKINDKLLSSKHEETKSSKEPKNTGPTKKFDLKNVLKSTNGKEFTIKVTEDILKKCFTKYSGGPEVISFIKKLREEEKKGIVKELRPDFINVYNYRLDNNNTFLHIAILENYPELVNYFVDKGASCNLQNDDGDTALHLAIKNGNINIIKKVLEGKAALDIANNDDVIPFEMLTSEQKKELGLEKLSIEKTKKKKKT
jgi:hypothetical protein